MFTVELVGKCFPRTMRVPKTFPARFSLDEYQGWLHFHCAPRYGPAGMVIRRAGKGWESRDARWKVIAVDPIDRDAYGRALEAQRIAQQNT